MNISDLMNSSSNNNDDRRSRPSQPAPNKVIDADRDHRQHPSQVFTPPLRQQHSFSQPRGTPPGDPQGPYARPSLEPSRSNSAALSYSHSHGTPTRSTPGAQYPGESPRYVQAGPGHAQSPVQGPGYQSHYPNGQRPPSSSSRYASQGSPVSYAPPPGREYPAQAQPGPPYPARYDQRLAQSPSVYQRESIAAPNGYPPQPQAPYGAYPHPQSQAQAKPNTPLGPPMPRRGSSLQTYPPQDPYAHRRSVSGHHAQSPASNVPGGLPHGSPSLHPDRQQSLDVQRTRTSPSLSPKSVPAHPYSQSTSRNPSIDHYAQRSSPHISQEQRPPTTSHPDLTSRPMSQAVHQDPSPRPRQQYTPSNPQRISSILSGPTESPRTAHMDDRSRASPAAREVKVEPSPHGTPSRSTPQVPKSESLLQQPVSHAVSSPPPPPPPRPLAQPPQEERRPPSPAPIVQKRPAEEPADVPTKRKKLRRKYDRPPIWARLAPKNPLYNPKLHKPDPTGQSAPPSQSAPNGQPVAQDAQLLDQKVKTSELLGAPWELSITDVVPSDELLTQVATFLYRGMLKHPELGAGQANAGNLEIEAKLGHFERRGEQGRLRLPVTSTVVLDPGYAREQLQFVSNMNMNQHMHMNNYLNDRIQESMNPHRVPLRYTHRRELDSFRTLSPQGKDILPPFPASEVNPHHTLKLRTTHNVDPKTRPPNMSGPGPVIARIVKRRLHDLSIYSPSTEYDLRISINVEVDLMHHPSTSAVDPETLTIALEDEKNRQPDRYKDRLSYAHCAYSIDLTQVTLGDPDDKDKTHELEVEVDPIKLRDQAEMLRQGKPNAFEALVQGLLSNCFLLMRVRGA